MSGTGTDPNSLRYQPVKIVRQFNSTGSLASQASSTSSTGEVQPEPIKCHLIEIKPVECTIAGGKRSRRKVGELSVKQEANTTPPVVKLEGTPSGNEAPGPATTSNLIDELFKEFLSIKMETIEAEYHEKQQKEKQEKERQEKVKQLQLQAKDNQDVCAGGDGCTTDVGNGNRRTHHSKEKSHKSKHKDRSHHKSSKHKNERRSRHGSRCEENNKDTHSSQDQRDEETNRMSDVDRRSSQADSPGPLQIDIGSDITNGMAEITPASAGNSDVNTDTQTIQKDLRMAVPAESFRTTSPGELESNVCHAPNKHRIPIVRVVAVKSSKPGTETAGNGNRGTVVEVSTHLQQEANVRAEKEDSLWDIALTSKGQDTKSDKEVPAPRSVFEKMDVTVKPLGFKFGITISEKSAELISSQNKEEGEVSGTDSDSGNNNDGETESVSGSDGETKSGKKKKRKHRHRKRKKHKRGSGDREDTSRKRPRSTSRSRTPKKHRHSRSRSRSTSRSRLRTGRWGRSRSRSRDRHWRSRSRDRDHHRHRSRSRSRGRRRSPLKDIYRGWRSRSRSHSRDKTKTNDLRVKIDKAKLRQIAIARAFNNMQTGQGPPVDLKPEQLLALKAGGHSVQELTDFCKKISQKDKPRRSSSDDTSDSTQNEEDEEAGPFIHHPFKLRDNQPNIVMNIANAKQLPILTPAMKASLGAELRVQFPVSSGSQHRAKEWVTVEKSTPVQATAKVSTAPPSQEDSVFPDPSAQPVSIGDVVSERLSAMRKLQSDPNDVQALTKIHHVDRQMESWVTSKMLPGQFTGSTDIQMLSQKELHGGYQAWIRKDQFARAAPVRGGIGMSLLQKMGWKQGEGLGKDNNGSLEPLALNVKMDRKGLSSQGENIKKSLPVPTRKDLSGKHPISALVELCNKKKWGPPDFIVVNESGPDHKKNFIIKVKVKGMEYQPSVSSGSKKLAKAQAATVCLQQLGLIPQ